jgi:hypothetical protein
MAEYNKITNALGTAGGNLEVITSPQRINPSGNIIPFAVRSKLTGNVDLAPEVLLIIDQLPVIDDELIINGVVIRSKVIPGQGEMFGVGSGAQLSDCAASIVTAINSNPSLNYKYVAIADNVNVYIRGKVNGPVSSMSITKPSYWVLQGNPNGYSKALAGTRKDYVVSVDVIKNEVAQLGWGTDPGLNINSDLIATLESSFNVNNNYEFDISNLIRGFNLPKSPVELGKENSIIPFKAYDLTPFAFRASEIYSVGTTRVKYPVLDWSWGWAWPASFDEKKVQNYEDYVWGANKFFKGTFNSKSKGGGWSNIQYVNFLGNQYTLPISSEANALSTLQTFCINMNTINTVYVWTAINATTFEVRSTVEGAGYNDNTLSISNFTNGVESDWWALTVLNAIDDVPCKPLSFGLSKWLPRDTTLSDTIYFIYERTNSNNTPIRLKVRYGLMNGSITGWRNWGGSLTTTGSGIYGANITIGQLASVDNPTASVSISDNTQVRWTEVAFFDGSTTSATRMTEPIRYIVEDVPHFNTYTEIIFKNSIGGYERAWFRGDKPANEKTDFSYTRTATRIPYDFTKKIVEVKERKTRALLTDALDFENINWMEEIGISTEVYLREEDGQFRPYIVTDIKMDRDNSLELYQCMIELEQSYTRTVR